MDLLISTFYSRYGTISKLKHKIFFSSQILAFSGLIMDHPKMNFLEAKFWLSTLLKFSKTKLVPHISFYLGDAQP